MIKIFPESKNELVRLDSPISITFDNDITPNRNLNDIFQVVDSLKKIIMGTTVFDYSTNTATFAALKPFKRNETISVTCKSMNVEKYYNNTTYQWSFKTVDITTIIFDIVWTPLNSNTKKTKNVSLLCKTICLLSEFKREICIATETYDPNEIDKIFFAGTEIEIESDFDVLQIQSNDVLEIVFIDDYLNQKKTKNEDYFLYMFSCLIFFGFLYF